MEKVEVTFVTVVFETIVVEVEDDDDNEYESEAEEQASSVFAKPLEDLGCSVTETEVYVGAKNKDEN